MGSPITVHYFERKAGPGRYSLERVFADIRQNLPADIRAVVLKCPYESTGILNRLCNIIWARRNAGPINHITGDVHYLSLALPRGRTILTIHDCVTLVRSKGLKHLILWLLWFRLPIMFSACVTVISEFTKRELLAHVRCDPPKIRVIHDPVSEYFKPASPPIHLTKKSRPYYL